MEAFECIIFGHGYDLKAAGEMHSTSTSSYAHRFRKCQKTKFLGPFDTDRMLKAQPGMDMCLLSVQYLILYEVALFVQGYFVFFNPLQNLGGVLFKVL